MDGDRDRFRLLRELSRALERGDAGDRRRALARARALGPLAIARCVRALRDAPPRQRAWALEALAVVAAHHPARVQVALRALVADPGAAFDDATRVELLALLASLGDAPLHATFHDPVAVQRRSLVELAALLDAPADVAQAAELVVQQLGPDELVDFVESLVDAAPDRAQHLVDELLRRSDLPCELRGALARASAPLLLREPTPLAPPPRRRPRVTTLAHPGGRRVHVVATSTPGGGARLLALLVGADGALTDGLYRDDASAAAIRDELLTPLREDGFGLRPGRAAQVRAEVAAAARRTLGGGRPLPTAYYLGRDLLELDDEHQPVGWRPDPATALLGRAVELLGAGAVDRARPLLQRCVELAPADADAASGLGLCLLAVGETIAARAHLERAARLAPAWALHRWNLAVLAHREGRVAACYLALRAFLDLADPADASPDHRARVALAAQRVADHERQVALDAPGADPRALAAEAECALVERPRPRATSAALTARRARAPRRRPVRDA